MPTYYDSQNQPHVLDKRLGSGGEGTVYSCEGNSQIVAKIYHEPVTAEKAAKLGWMAANQDENLNKVAAWVIDVLLDAPDGKVVGFLMPNIRAKEIHELYSLKSRRIHFREATWHFLIHTAANLARAFHNLHRNGHVMGDINHGNCVVLADGTVKLIDCDSYSIKAGQKRYPCEVGVVTHLAPEIQGTNLRKVEREANHDNFGLAVIIFQLLFLGRHPFAGNFLLGEDKPLEDCIREHLFAYGKNAKGIVAQPPGTLSLSALSPAVAGLFERAFTKKHHRPSPREWIEALEDLAASLEQCSLHPGHLFYEKNVLCPWCEIESQTGTMLFPIVTINSSLESKYKKPFDIVTIENLVASFDITPNLPVQLAENVKVAPVTPQPDVIKANNSRRIEVVFISSLYFIFLFGAYFALGEGGCVGCIFVMSIAVVCLLHTNYKKSNNAVIDKEQDRLYELEYKWNAFEKEWSKVAQSPILEREMLLIKGKIENYRTLQNVEPFENLPEADFEEVKNKKTIQRNSNSDNILIRSRLEKEISELLVSLRARSVQLKSQRQKLLSQSQKLSSDLAQTQSNVKASTARIPVGFIFIFITIATPVLNFAVSSFNEEEPVNRPIYSVPPPVPDKSSIPGSPPNISVAMPDEGITDNEIAALSSDRRKEIVDELIRLSDYALTSNKDDVAEKCLNFALRFDNENPVLLSRFGNFYYEQKKYEKALAYLKRSKKIDGNDGTAFLIGITYLNMKKYSQARDVFLKLTNGSMRANESFYNLGIAYQGLGDHKEAIKAFQEAIALRATDDDSIYLIGISFSKLGNKNEVRHYYQLLKNLDERRAANFKKAVEKTVNLDTSPETIR